MSNEPNNKGIFDKFVDLFFERDLRSVVIDTIRDIIVPAIKDTFVNSVNNAANMLVGGGYSRSRPDDVRRNGREPGSRYHSGLRHEPGATQLSSPKEDEPDTSARMSKSMDRIWVETKSIADDIVNSILEHFAEYDILTVADLISFADIRENNWTRNDWGWLDINGDNIRVVYVPDNRRGYQWEIQLPRPHRVD